MSSTSLTPPPTTYPLAVTSLKGRLLGCQGSDPEGLPVLAFYLEEEYHLLPLAFYQLDGFSTSAIEGEAFRVVLQLGITTPSTLSSSLAFSRTALRSSLLPFSGNCVRMGCLCVSIRRSMVSQDAAGM